MTSAAGDTRWAGTRWAHTPHVRFGDPCFGCGTPMTPASREWCAATMPEGYRLHAGHGCCSTCVKKYRAAGVLDAPEAPAPDATEAAP